MFLNKNKNDKAMDKLPFNEEFCDSFTQASKFGTYEIQPSNDTDNPYPAISQGLSQKAAQKAAKAQKLWQDKKIKADDH